MIPLKKYLLEGFLPNDKSKATKLRAKAYDYYIHESNLYRKGKGRLDLKCLTEAKYQKVLKELHRGVCRLHSGYGQ